MSSALTQEEADALLAMAKHYHGSNIFMFPSLGGKLRIPLQSQDKQEAFIIDLTRGYVSVRKQSIQNRARKTIPLARLDTAWGLHRNPDGEDVPCPHLHLYREGFEDKWAFPLPAGLFENLDDAWQTLDDFMEYCNVATKPAISRGPGDLFS